MVINNLLSDTLYEGQVLKVPSDLEGLESVRLEHLASAKEQLEAVKD